MRTTSQLRTLWAPACARIDRRHLVTAYEALDRCFQAWKYPVRSGQTWGYNCRKITGGTGYSLHAFAEDSGFAFWTGVKVAMAVAVDVNSLANPYGPRLVTDMPRPMVEAILGIRTNNGAQVWGWGGNYRNNKDAMHFELVCSPAELATGVNWATVPGMVAPVPPSPPSQPEPELEDDEMQVVVYPEGGGACYLLLGDGKKLRISNWDGRDGKDPNSSVVKNWGEKRIVLFEVAKDQLASIPHSDGSTGLK